MSIIIAALTALGFVYRVAWIAATLLLLALGYIAYTKWKASHRRFFCNEMRPRLAQLRLDLGYGRLVYVALL